MDTKKREKGKTGREWSGRVSDGIRTHTSWFTARHAATSTLRTPSKTKGDGGHFANCPPSPFLKAERKEWESNPHDSIEASHGLANRPGEPYPAPFQVRTQTHLQIQLQVPVSNRTGQAYETRLGTSRTCSIPPSSQGET